jgi:hypothetical protein
MRQHPPASPISDRLPQQIPPIYPERSFPRSSPPPGCAGTNDGAQLDRKVALQPIWRLMAAIDGKRSGSLWHTK